MKLTTNKLIKMSLVMFIFCTGWSTLGQTFTAEEEENANESTVTKLSSADVFRTLGISNASNTLRSASLQGNKVLLRQVGDFNQLNVVTQTRASDISVVQQGNDNRTSLEYNTNTAFARLAQFGNGNTIRDYVYNPEDDVSLELTQQGNNMYFERFGSNSLTKSLTLKQTEASPVIIIRSFN